MSQWVQSGPPVWHPVGDLRGPPGPSVENVPFFMQGLLRVVTSVGKYPISGDCRVLSVAAMVEDAPTGQPIILDVLASGVSIYADPADRPHIMPGETTAIVGPHIDAVLEDGAYLNCNVVQIGSPLPGAFLTVAIRLIRGGDTSP